MTHKLLYVIILLTFFCLLTPCHILEAQIIKIGKMEVIYKNTKTYDEDAITSSMGLYKDEPFDIKKIKSGILQLKKFYFDNGFFDIAVDTSIAFNQEDETMLLKFFIFENKHYKIDNLIYKGLEKVLPETSAKISKIQTIGPDKFYNKILIIQQSNEVLDYLQNHGYMNARMKIDSGIIIKKYSENSNPKLSVILNFEGADTVFHFGKTDIHIDSNVYNVSEELLRKEIGYNEGDIYSKEVKLNSERDVSKISIVQSTRIEITSIHGDIADFRANIKLNKRNEVIPYLKGTNIENHFYFGGGVQYLNKYFSSGGKVLSFQLDALYNSLKINRFEFSTILTQPHFLNITKSTISDKLTIGLYNLEGFKNYYLGNSTTVNYFISEKTFYNNAFLDLNEELVRFKFDNDTSLLNVFHSILNVTAVHDNTNDLLSPSRGYYHSITLGSAGLIPKLIIHAFKNFYYSEYFKAYSYNRFYFNLPSLTSIFATSFKVGDIIEYGSGDRLIPIQSIYKFFSGGSGSLRGWNAKGNGVLANKLNGGKFLLEGSLELRKKLFPRKENFLKNISGAFFLDYGNVWESHKDFKLKQIALAIGFGVRYNLFIGPIRVDFGFKLYDPLDQDKWLFNNFSRIFKDKFAIQFGIGEAF